METIIRRGKKTLYQWLNIIVDTVLHMESNFGYIPAFLDILYKILICTCQSNDEWITTQIYNDIVYNCLWPITKLKATNYWD